MSEQKKRLRFLGRIIFFLNSIFAALLLLSYILPYAVPKNFPILSVFSLLVPVFIVINFCFMLFWILNVRKQFLLSFFVLVIGYSHVTVTFTLATNRNGVSLNSFFHSSF